MATLYNRVWQVDCLYQEVYGSNPNVSVDIYTPVVKTGGYKEMPDGFGGSDTKQDVFIKKDDDNWAIWTGCSYDSYTGAIIEYTAVEETVGTLADGDAVEVMIVVAASTLASLLP